MGVVFNGAELTIRVEFEAPGTADTALAIGIYRTDGVHAAGPLHRFSTSGADKHTVDCHIPSVALAAGTYDVAIRFLDDHLQTTYANRRRAARLDVESSDKTNIGGIIALGGGWTIR